MPIKTTKLGPGTLTLGAGALQVNAQLTGCKVTPSESVESTDAVKVLSGEELAAEESATYSFALEGNFLQDLEMGGAASVVAWSWDNMGTEQAFVFTPNTAAGVSVTGTLTPVPLTVGGDEADANMVSDFTWRIKGTPTYDDVA
jgi:hypothetical protein